MRRRSRESGAPVKARRRKPRAVKRPNAPKTARRRRNFAVGKETEVARLTRELDEALQQQTATAEVLRVISSSPGQLDLVFQTMLERATRVCGANFGVLFRYEDGLFYPAASLDVPPAYADFLSQQGSFAPKPGQLFGRLCQSKTVIHIVDRATEPYVSPSVRYAGARSSIAVPMLKENELVGAFFIYRIEVRPFTDKQIELAMNFAAQAVIAIENTRLLNELRQSLQQQTATADVLKVISSSPGELDPVFQAMLENATRICEAKFGTMYFREGDGFRAVAMHGAPPAYVESRLHKLVHPGPNTSIGRIVATKRVVQVEDASADPGYSAGDPMRVAAVNLGGIRTLLSVPLLKENELIGAISIYRQEVRPFTDKQIALVQNFAAQAVIAIENARLLNELRQRTDDLTESLEQQTATSEVLRVISSSPGELKPVFQAMLENAVRICEAKFGTLIRFDGSAFHYATQVSAPAAYAGFQMRRGPFQPTPGALLDRVMRTKQVIHTADETAEAVPGPSAKFGGARSNVCVPMLKDDELIGAILIYRQEVRPFTDKQIALVQNFAAQAVIAIENTRLLNELRKSLQQQTATADVLRVISASPGELMPVFNAMLENATRLCEASYGTMWLRESDGQIRRAANYGMLPEAFQEKWRVGTTFRPSPSLPTARAFKTGKPVQVIDLKNDPSYLDRDPLAVAAVEIAGIRSLISVPMLREGANVGTLNVYRREVLPFTDKQIELLTNFAAQAVIAIENTRLLNELRESLERQTATADVLRVISSSPGQLEPVFHSMLMNAVKICEANYGILYAFSDGTFRPAAQYALPKTFADFIQKRGAFRAPPESTLGIIERTKQIVVRSDISKDDPSNPAAKFGGARSFVEVPMLKDDMLAGVILIYRQEARPFTDKQIELLTNFAAQAIIAIENTRLLNELRQSLEQQTATADVLKVISSSPGELEPVFHAMLENATRICAAEFGTLYRHDGEMFHIAAEIGAPAEYSEVRRQRGPFAPRPGGLLDKVTPNEADDPYRRRRNSGQYACAAWWGAFSGYRSDAQG